MKNICELIGTEYPVIQGGMANIATYQLAAAVSNAGGLGLIGTGGWDPDRVRDEIKACKDLTDKPFGVNIMLMNPHAKDIAKVVIEEGVKVVTTGAGNPGTFIKDWKDAGIVVIPVVPSVALAKRVERSGADAVVVEGTEAGGHIGELTTMTLVPQVSDAVNIPVIAAGGIADSRQVLSAFVLGAKGVQIGTAFLLAEECPIHINYKNRIVKAKDTDTVVTGRKAGAPVRVIKNRMAKEYLKLAEQGATMHELEKLTLGSLRKAVLEGDIDYGSVMAGQVAGMLKEVKPAKALVKDLFKDIEKLKAEIEVY
ncbi:enoyl-[acyl-carrier-protein] reductase FabK [Haloplasma contractile]|uniref:Enoyl-acyl carrier protein reductase II n=1 Tax=Haloplasma contractile SSD-17B TaxID=1033810 RepID=U2E8E5_9MOLU|nr:enoyl-[acyl-carrier-protein] reductase FabK [Haloplasma contractile]ERJ11448.1 enoyl-acyl carrier protein reductase II [Haloplasma contractile SSD-17B]